MSSLQNAFFRQKWSFKILKITQLLAFNPGGSKGVTGIKRKERELSFHPQIVCEAFTSFHRKSFQFMQNENMESLNLIKIYQFTCLVAELTCNPFIVSATVNAHMQKYIEVYCLLHPLIRLLKHWNFAVFVGLFCWKELLNFENGNPTILFCGKILRNKYSLYSVPVRKK